MADPQISVLLPVYNAKRYVQSAVESILAQTFTNFELLLMDDGSTDGSKEILEALAAKDKRIRLIRQPNQGLLKTLNQGVGLCRAEFIARMDADDISLPTRFEKQLAFLKAHPEVVLLGTRVLMIDPDGIAIYETNKVTSHEDIQASHLAGMTAVCHPSAMIRRSAMNIAGEYRGQANEDLDLWLRLAEHGRVANLPEALVQYRQHVVSKYYQEQGFTPYTARRSWTLHALFHGNYVAAFRLAVLTAREAPAKPGAWAVLALATAGPVGRGYLLMRHWAARRSGKKSSEKRLVVDSE